jgi:hypothetical protein
MKYSLKLPHPRCIPRHAGFSAAELQLFGVAGMPAAARTITRAQGHAGPFPPRPDRRCPLATIHRQVRVEALFRSTDELIRTNRIAAYRPRRTNTGRPKP